MPKPRVANRWPSTGSMQTPNETRCFQTMVKCAFAAVWVLAPPARTHSFFASAKSNTSPWPCAGKWWLRLHSPCFFGAGKIEGLHYATMDSEAPAQLAAFIFAASGSKFASVPGIGSGVRCAPQAKRVRTPTASCGWKCSDPKAESGFPLQQKEVACWGVGLALLCPQNHEHMLFRIQCSRIVSITLFQHVVHARWGKGNRCLKLRD